MSSFIADQYTSNYENRIVFPFEDYLLTQIFKFLSPLELLSATLCSSSWYLAGSRDKQLWERHTQQLWSRDSNRLMNIPDIDNLDIMNRIRKIPLTKLKHALLRVDITRCIEKQDFQKMLMTHLLFKDRPDLRNTGHLRIYYPEWCLNRLGSFKATYFHNRRDLKRTTILASELCLIDWIFRFKNDYYTQDTFHSKFLDDFTMESEMHDQIYSWQFVVDNKVDY